VVATVVLNVPGDVHPRDLSRAEVAAAGEGADALLEEAELWDFVSLLGLWERRLWLGGVSEGKGKLTS
jgi:hypothetical protein